MQEIRCLPAFLPDRVTTILRRFFLREEVQNVHLQNCESRLSACMQSGTCKIYMQALIHPTEGVGGELHINKIFVNISQENYEIC